MVRGDIKTVFVCQGTGCISGSSEKIYSILDEQFEKIDGGNRIRIKRTGCHGFCQQGPLVVIEPEGILYTKVKTEDVTDIIKSLISEVKPIERLLYRDPYSDKPIPLYHDIPFYSQQERTILRYCGNIDPEDIEGYLAVGGYKALQKAIFEMTPDEVISEVKRSGLRGLGGAGFPTGIKWEACRNASGDERYVICNADEGDPGAFQDRSVLEGNPHLVLEGMIIAAYAINAGKCIIYVRAEYPLAVKRLKIAMEQARRNGFSGRNILDNDFSIDMEIFQGAGAFVCGESTALVRSIEGKRGRPKPLPRARTSEIGLWNKPTLLNNVKTFANIPLIISHGSDWFASKGTDKSKGTAVFSLTGKVVNCGLIEVPMGITLRKIIYDIGGGVPGGKAFKAVQTGGPSGGCLPESMLDMTVDFDSLKQAGSIMGSGGMVVMDEDTCMVDVARYFLDFTQRESCGQCIPCRLGTKQMFDILDDITKGKGRPDDIDLLIELSEAIKRSSICGLGQTVPNPVLTTIRYFRDEYKAHIRDKKCPAGVCNMSC
jgi:NADH:ubiquinone oxidoreductase subunit F (NADH-binding)/(2Fe-2S) ferredoxin